MSRGYSQLSLDFQEVGVLFLTACDFSLPDDTVVCTVKRVAI